jgi:hypothetical protein
MRKVQSKLGHSNRPSKYEIVPWKNGLNQSRITSHIHSTNRPEKAPKWRKLATIENTENQWQL